MDIENSGIKYEIDDTCTLEVCIKLTKLWNPYEKLFWMQLHFCSKLNTIKSRLVCFYKWF